MGRESNNKKSPSPQVNTKGNENSKHAISDMAPMDIKRYIQDLIDEFKSEIFSQIKQDIKRLMKEILSTPQADTDRRREKLITGENHLVKNIKNIEYMKQIQRNHQEIKKLYGKMANQLERN